MGSGSGVGVRAGGLQVRAWILSTMGSHQSILGFFLLLTKIESFYLFISLSFPDGSVVKNLPANTGDTHWTPGLGKSPGVGNGNPLQYSCLGNPKDRGALWANIHEVAKESDMTLATKQEQTSVNLYDQWLWLPCGGQTLAGLETTMKSHSRLLF